MPSLANSELQHHVIEELEWEPSVDSSKIGVTAESGIVTVTGHVANYSEKRAAERIAKRVASVDAVANNIEVKLDGHRDDTDIAAAAVDALRWNVSLPKDKVT